MLNKTLIGITLSVLLLLTTACSDNKTPQVGKHYSVLEQDLSDNQLPPISEVFSLTCGHCWNMEASIPEIERLTNQKVGKVHVMFNESAQIAAMLYYAAEMQLGTQPDHEMVEALFAVVQSKEGTLAEKQATIEEIFTSRALISPYHLDEGAFAKLKDYLDNAAEVSEKAMIMSVPSFIVAGKYLLKTENHEDLQELSATINYLLTKPE